MREKERKKQSLTGVINAERRSRTRKHFSSIRKIIGQLFYFVEPEVAARKCEICGARFPSADELAAHKNETHIRKVEQQI